MGLMPTLRRGWYVYSWRLRYWWLDTRAGMQARLMLYLVSALAGIAWCWRLFTAPAVVPDLQHPQQSVVIAIVIAIIALIIALAAVLMMPGAPEAPPARSGVTPTTEDGQGVKHHFGTCWVDDSFLLAWKIVRTDPIKASGGK